MVSEHICPHEFAVPVSFFLFQLSSMAIESTLSPSQTNTDSPFSPSNLIFINASTQAPLKLTTTNYFHWKAQFDALLIGYDLIGYVDGSIPCPSNITTGSPADSMVQRWFWICQDKLILVAILVSFSKDVVPLFSCAQTSKAAWDKLATLYATASCSRILLLYER